MDQNTTKKPINAKRIGIIIGAVVAVGAVAFVIFLIMRNLAKHDVVSVYDSDVFFIAENNSSDAKSALFNNKGERLTDFIYKDTYSFVDGYALVEDNDGNASIIDSKGNVSLEFGQNSVSSYAGFYYTTHESENVILLGNGTEVAKGFQGYENDSATPFVVVKTSDDEYSLYNVHGDNVKTFQSKESPELRSYDRRVASVLKADGVVYLLDNLNLKIAGELATGEDYKIEEASKDGKTFVLRSGQYGSYKFAVFNDGKFNEYGDRCQDVDINENEDIHKKYLECEGKEDTALIRGGEISDIKTSGYDDRYYVFDENHYANYHSGDNKLDIYVDGNMVSSVDCNYSPSIDYAGYSVRGKDSVVLYGLDGKEIYKLSDTNNGELSGLDVNENIIVRNGKENYTSRYSIVNKSGETITDKYYSIVARGKYYSARNYDESNYDLIDKSGNKILSGYESYEITSDEKVMTAKDKDRKYHLVDEKNKTVTTEFSERPSYYEGQYLRVDGDEKVSYYTIEGKLFHEYNK